MPLVTPNAHQSIEATPKLSLRGCAGRQDESSRTVIGTGAAILISEAIRRRGTIALSIT
jgi:hypothetical protein